MNKRAGFTIVELLIVIVVIGILAAITIVAFNGVTARTKDAVVQSDLESAYKKLETLKITSATQTYPLSLADTGLTGSNGTTFNYFSRSGGAGYCATSSYGAKQYYITSATSTVEEGSCEHLSLWLPGASGDSSGYALPLTLNEATTGSGTSSSAYVFNGSQRIIVGSASPINLSDGSISLWVNRASTNGNLLTIGAPGATGAALTVSSLFVYISSGTVYAGWNDGAVASPDHDQAVSNAGLSLGQWYNLVLSWQSSPSNIRLYVNGVVQSTQDVFSNNNKTGWDDQIVIGGLSSGGNFSGMIDDLRIFDHALTDSEVSTLYGNGAL